MGKYELSVIVRLSHGILVRLDKKVILTAPVLPLAVWVSISEMIGGQDCHLLAHCIFSVIISLDPFFSYEKKKSALYCGWAVVTELIWEVKLIYFFFGGPGVIIR